MEELVHFPLLLSHPPKIFWSWAEPSAGLIHEILKHPVEKVHYAEIDPLVIQFIGENLTPLTRGEMEDPKVRVHPLDGRLFIKDDAGEI